MKLLVKKKHQELFYFIVFCYYCIVDNIKSSLQDKIEKKY